MLEVLSVCDPGNVAFVAPALIHLDFSPLFFLEIEILGILEMAIGFEFWRRATKNSHIDAVQKVLH